MTPSASVARAERADPQPIPMPAGPENPACPKCSGRMWDNRTSKRNPAAPDFKCRNRSCDGVLWPGQHRAGFPARPLPRLAEVRDDAQSFTQSDDGVEKLLPILRSKYLDLTAFVLDSVRPIYEKHGLECRPDTVAAIAATLYIAETRRDGL